MISRAAVLLVLVWAFASISLRAGPQPLHTNAAPIPFAVTNAAVIQIGPGIFQIGKVILDKSKRAISIPATVNMREGTIEYALVHATGKVHESLFKTDVEPYHLNVAFLLLGEKGGIVKTKTPEEKTSEINGDKIHVSASWKTNDLEVTFPIEELITDVETRTNASHGDWIYNGSRVIDGTFLAQRDGSLISTIADPDALINNPRPARDNDDAWQVNTTNVPPVNTSVQIRFELQKVK